MPTRDQEGLTGRAGKTFSRLLFFGVIMIEDAYQSQAEWPDLAPPGLRSGLEYLLPAIRYGIEKGLLLVKSGLPQENPDKLHFEILQTGIRSVVMLDSSGTSLPSCSCEFFEIYSSVILPPRFPICPHIMAVLTHIGRYEFLLPNLI